MTGPRPNRPRTLDSVELGTTDPTELADALEIARRLAASIDEAPITTGTQFSDRVMAALADEPVPAQIGFLAPLRRLGIVRGFGASVRQAWASIGAPGRPTFARAAALAYVLVIAIAGTSLAGAATITVAGAFGIIGPRDTQTIPTKAPQSTSPAPSERPSAESEPPGPEASEDPSDGPDATDDHGGGGSEPSDDNGGVSGSGGSGHAGSDDGSGGGGGEDSATGSPDGGGDGSDDGGGWSTPRPSQSPRPTGTPRPTSGSGDSSGGSSSG